MMRPQPSPSSVPGPARAVHPPMRLPSRQSGRTGFTFHGLIGRTPVMQQLFAAIERFAPHARATLITGDIGTGKAAVAQTLYRLGPRRGGAFVAVPCTTVPATGGDWVEAALTAERDTTLFFDDVADLPDVEQVRLGRLLGDGDGDGAGADGAGAVHVIAATSRDLPAAIADGRFRSDLYYRLGVFTLHLPRLRDRLDDLPELAAAFLRDIGGRLRQPTRRLSPGALRVLGTHAWPGNLRELHNVLQRAAVLSDDDVVGEGAVRIALAGPASAVADVAEASTEPSPRLDDAQRAHVLGVLRSVHGNKSRAAVSLGISRRALYRLLDRLGA